jgi:hypothetical protein
MLLRKIPGKLLVIWDGAPIHRSRVVKDFLSAGGTKCILFSVVQEHSIAEVARQNFSG